MADQGQGAREHARIVREILARCGARPDCRLWANQTGVGRAMTGDNVIRFGLVGSADILGIGIHGIFLGFEVKTGSARQTKAQRAFGDMINGFGGIYAVVRNADEAELVLNCLAP